MAFARKINLTSPAGTPRRRPYPVGRLRQLGAQKKVPCRKADILTNLTDVERVASGTQARGGLVLSARRNASSLVLPSRVDGRLYCVSLVRQALVAAVPQWMSLDGCCRPLAGARGQQDACRRRQRALLSLHPLPTNSQNLCPQGRLQDQSSNPSPHLFLPDHPSPPPFKAREASALPPLPPRVSPRARRLPRPWI
ncbi:hypothetical protein GQ53DRAFT_293436 [Thozetella sp. PMI_491]|nr:hypothetical protein GQ53DRAFT_293436 [Thozetella sp. PMI_491]